MDCPEAASGQLQGPAAEALEESLRCVTFGHYNRPHMQGVVRAVFVFSEKKAKPIPISSVEATVRGFEGDHHSRATNPRQVLMISGNVLDELDLHPGAVFENVVIDGLDVMSLAEGQRLRLGGALVEVTLPCEPCGQMDRVRSVLREALRGRRGMFVKVITPGTVRVGDTMAQFQ